MFTRLSRIIKLGFTNFYRNWSLSLAAVLMTGLTLFVVTVFLVIHSVGGGAADAIKNKIDMKVYFDDGVPAEEIKDIEFKIKSRFNIDSIIFIDKDEALARWQSRSIAQKTKDLITKDDNPLPRTLEIKSADPKILSDITQVLSSQAYQGKIYRLTYPENQTIIEKMSSLTRLINVAGISLSAILIIISALVIFNTIRLTIFSRQEEIEIMQLVGASSSFVRLPFIVEALLYGIIAAILTLLAFFASLKLFSAALINNLDFYWFDARNLILGKIWFLVGVQFGLGIVISIISSWISVKKYLS